MHGQAGNASLLLKGEGIVTLSGSLTNSKKKTDIEKRVTPVGGLTTVRNEINVLPASTFDNDLRHRIARAIYGHTEFRHYVARRHRPIHIVANHGHVILTGVVDTLAD